jgi:hypothetical protein
MIIPCFAFETLQEYKDNFERTIFEKPRQCKHCEAIDSFWRHGNFRRKVIEDGAETIVKIPRLLCHSCGKTVSLLFSFLIAHTQHIASTVADGVEKYCITDTSYRQVSGELNALDSKDKPTSPSHSSIFRWVKVAARKATQINFQIQKEAAMRAIQDLSHFSCIGICPNAEKAKSSSKCNLLNDLLECLQLAALLVDSHAGVVRRLHTFFLQNVETIQMILCNHLIELRAQQNARHMIF